MNEKTLKLYLEQIEHGGFPPTIGFRIDLETFCKFAEKAVCGIIPKHGWKKYKDYMDSWYIKIDKK